MGTKNKVFHRRFKGESLGNQGFWGLFWCIEIVYISIEVGDFLLCLILLLDVGRNGVDNTYVCILMYICVMVMKMKR